MIKSDPVSVTRHIPLYLAFGLLACFSACANKPVHTAGIETSGTSRVAVSQEKYWWYCRFKLHWPENTDFDLVPDLMLAHAVVKPVLDAYRPKLDYWRFHRRAVHDAAGHQFSFIFYTDPGTAAAVMFDLKKSAILQQALSENIVEKISFDDTNNPDKPDLEDTSDQRWPPEIQKNWPAYIMGVSSTWLGLISDMMTDTPAVDNIHELVEQYRKVDSDIASMWSRNGQHAFIHHLSAVFGYEPITIKQEVRF